MNCIHHIKSEPALKFHAWSEHQKTALTANELTGERLRETVGSVITELQECLLDGDLSANRKYIQRLLRCVTRLSAIAYSENRGLYKDMAAVVKEHFPTLIPHLPIDLKLKADCSTIKASALALMQVSDVFAKMIGTKFGERKEFIDHYPVGDLCQKVKINLREMSHEQLWLLVDCAMYREPDVRIAEKTIADDFFGRTMDYWNIQEPDRECFQDWVRCSRFRAVYAAGSWYNVCPDLSSRNPILIEAAIEQLSKDRTVDHLLTLLCVFEDLMKIEDVRPLLQRILSKVTVDWTSGSPEAIEVLLRKLSDLGELQICEAYLEYLCQTRSVPELLKMIGNPKQLLGRSLASVFSQITVDWSSGTVDEQKRLLPYMDRMGNPLAVLRYFERVVGECTDEQLLRTLEGEHVLPFLTIEESSIYAKRFIWTQLRQWFQAIAADWDADSTSLAIRGAKQRIGTRKTLDPTLVSNLQRFATVAPSLHPWNFHGREMDGFSKPVQDWLMNAVNGRLQ